MSQFVDTAAEAHAALEDQHHLLCLQPLCGNSAACHKFDVRVTLQRSSHGCSTCRHCCGGCDNSVGCMTGLTSASMIRLLCKVHAINATGFWETNAAVIATSLVGGSCTALTLAHDCLLCKCTLSTALALGRPTLPLCTLHRRTAGCFRFPERTVASSSIPPEARK